MIEVELPDGSIAEFPDGTSNDVIKGALQKRFAPPAQPQEMAAPKTDRLPEELPWYAKAGQAADDMVRLAANGMTFGYADKLAGMLSGTGTDAERGATAGARDRAGSAGAVAEIGGAIATPMGLAGKGATLAGRFGTGAMQGAGGLAARTGLMAAEGAGYGALTAAGNDQDIASGAGIGALAGGAGNVIGEGLSAGISKIAGALSKSPSIPTRDALVTAKNAAYDAAENAGVAYTPQAIQRVGQKVATELADMGFDPALQPGAAVAIKRITDLAGQNVTLKGLDTIRKVASNGFVPGNKSNNLAISKIIDTIDDLIENPQASDILMGNGATGAAAIKQARALASRVSKLDRVDEAVSRADLRASSTGSGGNADNATRQNIRRLLEKPRGFSPDERQALETIVRGSSGQNALRLAGKLSPSGNGLMAALGVGGAMVNPMVGVASLGGMGAKAVADRMTQSNVSELAKIIAAGGSKAATKGPKNAIQRLAESERDTIIRLLMGGSINQAVAP